MSEPDDILTRVELMDLVKKGRIYHKKGSRPLHAGEVTMVVNAIHPLLPELIKRSHNTVAMETFVTVAEAAQKAIQSLESANRHIEISTKQTREHTASLDRIMEVFKTKKEDL